MIPSSVIMEGKLRTAPGASNVEATRARRAMKNGVIVETMMISRTEREPAFSIRTGFSVSTCILACAAIRFCSIQKRNLSRIPGGRHSCSRSRPTSLPTASDEPAFLKRVETICNTCETHLGHVFPDGLEPGGLRYCMNAVALKKAAKT